MYQNVSTLKHKLSKPEESLLNCGTNKCSYLLRFPHWLMQDVSHRMISFDGQMPQ